jgi:hypothetical protein
MCIIIYIKNKINNMLQFINNLIFYVKSGFDSHVTFATVGGTVITVLGIAPVTIYTTIIVGFLGAVTSFLTSLLCKRLYERFFKKD